MNVMERFVCNARVSSTLKIISIEVVSSAERVSFQTTVLFLLLPFFRHHLSISPSLAYRKKSLYAHFFFSPSWFHCYLSVRMKSQTYAKMCTQKKELKSHGQWCRPEDRECKAERRNCERGHERIENVSVSLHILHIFAIVLHSDTLVH